jgi:hypothetical protein
MPGSRAGAGEHLIPGGFRDEFFEGLADDRGPGATPRRCLDLGIPRVMRVFDPVIEIAAAYPLARGPGVEPIPAGTPQNRSDNISMSASSRTMRHDRLQVDVG